MDISAARYEVADSGPLSAAYVEACLLLALVERPAYGYELKRDLDDLGLHTLERGRIYRALRSLEAEGVVLSHWETANRGPARRTYELTNLGYDRLREHALAVRRHRLQLSRYLTRYERVRSTHTVAVA